MPVPDWEDVAGLVEPYIVRKVEVSLDNDEIIALMEGADVELVALGETEICVLHHSYKMTYDDEYTAEGSPQELRFNLKLGSANVGSQVTIPFDDDTWYVPNANISASKGARFGPLSLASSNVAAEVLGGAVTNQLDILILYVAV